MRVWLLALMIALLPLRGWVGDAMALAAWPAAVTAAASATSVAPTPPCHGEAAMNPGDAHAATAVEQAPGGHTVCNNCDICHGTVLGGTVAVHGDPQPVSAPTAPAPARFASAVLPGQHKPPIA